MSRMSDTTADTAAALEDRKRTIAGLRRQARERHGRNKANWPEPTLTRIQRLIELCRQDERALRDAFSSAPVLLAPVVFNPPETDSYREQRDREWSARFHERNAPPHRTRPLLVVDNGKGMGR